MRHASLLSILLIVTLLAGCSLPAGMGAAPALPTAPPAVALPTAAPRIATTPVVPPTAVLPTAVPPTAVPVPPQPNYAAAMRAPFVGDIAALPNLPRYTMRLRVDPDAQTITGTVQLVYTNTTGVPLDSIALRLYPNFPQDLFGSGGDTRMDITAVAVQGQPVAFQYAAQDTAVLLPLLAPLAPQQGTQLEVAFTANIKPWRDGSIPLTAYYPMLAMWGSDGWRLDVTQFPDHVISESALYAVEVHAPTPWGVVASGSTLASTPRSDGTTLWQIVTGPMRQFALSVGKFASLREQAGDVQVNVHTALGNGIFLREYLATTVSALGTFERLFGAYPYRELDVHVLPYTFDGGDEYPGIVFIFSDGAFDAGARYVTAHEIAHQWWFGVVGNDIFNEPWLDEAFAQYSGILAVGEQAGSAAAAADYEREVLRRYRGAIADGDLPIGWSIARYGNFNVYYRTVYGKGAVFLATLRETVGDAAFFGALQAHYARHRYGIATGREVQQVFEAASGQNLEGLFQTWVYGWE